MSESKTVQLTQEEIQAKEKKETEMKILNRLSNSEKANATINNTKKQ